MTDQISPKIVERLTLYHSILVEYLGQGVESISSPQIASRLNIDDSQVRKDCKYINNIGKRRVGYNVVELKESIEKTLGFSEPKDAFIVGAGYVGLALARYDNFKNYGLNILALFDNDPVKVGMQFSDKEVFHISKLPDLAERLNTEIAILTLPREYAQDMADFLVKSNVKYIWNFTPAVLKVPKDVKVWNENLISNFLQFACKDIEQKKI